MKPPRPRPEGDSQTIDTDRLQEQYDSFVNNRYLTLAGFEPARKRFLASQNPSTLPTELSGRPKSYLDLY